MVLSRLRLDLRFHWPSPLIFAPASRRSFFMHNFLYLLICDTSAIAIIYIFLRIISGQLTYIRKKRMFIMNTYQTLTLLFQFGGFIVALLVYIHKTK